MLILLPSVCINAVINRVIFTDKCSILNNLDNNHYDTIWSFPSQSELTPFEK